MVAIKSKSIDEISAMADQRLPVPGADVAWLVRRVRELEAQLETHIVAVDDWLRTYASDMCHEHHVKESWARIWGNGGTLAYIAEIQQSARDLLQSDDPALTELARLGQEIEGEQEKRDREIRNKALEEAAKLMTQRMTIAEAAAGRCVMVEHIRMNDRTASIYESAAIDIRALKEPS